MSPYIVFIYCIHFAAISITCISPIEMIRTKMQARKGFSYKGTTSMSSHRDVFILFLNLFYRPNNNFVFFL